MICCAVEVDIYDENDKLGTVRVDTFAVRSGEVLVSTKRLGTRVLAVECSCDYSKKTPAV